jgi:hypothetical protein
MNKQQKKDLVNKRRYLQKIYRKYDKCFQKIYVINGSHINETTTLDVPSSCFSHFTTKELQFLISDTKIAIDELRPHITKELEHRLVDKILK